MNYDIGKRFPNNPIFSPADLLPSRPEFEVTCVLNPGAFEFDGRVGLVMRVAERNVPREGYISTPVLGDDGKIQSFEVRLDDPKLRCDDPRSFYYDGKFYLTTMSHLLVAWSDDGGRTFVPDYGLRLFPELPTEAYGIEDCRVEKIDGTYYLAFTAVSCDGICLGQRTTRDWKSFTPTELMFPPSNKDAAFFPRKINGRYFTLHRPSHSNRNDIFLAESPDLRCWGNHRCIVHAREESWDSERIGAGASPIETEAGFLEIYHGADRTGRYCLGLLLFDKNDPGKVLARSERPVMEPREEYECKGFYGNCIFTNGQIVRGDEVTIYYGASDTVICGATFLLRELLASLGY